MRDVPQWVVMHDRYMRVLGAIAFAAALTQSGISAQQAPPASPPLALAAAIPFDAAVRTGRLPNGITFFIRHNVEPEKRVSLRLAVKAGSIDEADDQQGLAHMVEHMAFNGSAHFKPGEIFSYFESVGARLGPHVNAYTSFDETVYMLDLPSDKPEVVTKGVTALADFAGGLTLDPTEVDKERGVVIEEWRGGLGAQSRVRDKQFPVIFDKSRYAERLPIGKPDIIRSAPAARLRAFYDTWYRPERMAVIVVGDVDEQTMDRDIRTAFTPLADRAPAAPEPDKSVPLNHQTLVSAVTDPELTRSTVQLMRKHPHEGELTVGEYRRGLAERLIADMTNDRFGELSRRADAKFLGAQVGGGSLTQTVDTFTFSAAVQDGHVADGLGALVTEAKRVREFGFTDAELDRTKRSMQAFMDRAYSERDKTDSGSFAQEYLSYFLEQEPSPGIAYEYRLVQQLLPTITAAELGTLSRELLADDSRVLLATAPDKPGAGTPTEAQFRDAMTAAEAQTVTPWNENIATGDLADHIPPASAPPAAPKSIRQLPGLGITIVQFANGVEAWLKPTDFKNDQVLFELNAPGGASLAAPADYVDATLATSYVRLAGVGGIKPVDLQKMLAGKIASAVPFVDLSTQGISGSAAPAQLETALQLLYLDFTAPNDDPDAFALLKRQLAAAVANRDQSPQQAFAERVGAIDTSNHYTAQPLTTAHVDALDRGKMMAFYRQRFSNAADFTFFMVGTFDVARTIPLLARYVGSLPSTGSAASKYADVGLRFPATPVRETIVKGKEPRAQTVMSFFADPPSTPLDQEYVLAATTVLEIALRDALREELGQTYTVSAGLVQPTPQKGDGHIRISFGSAPENVKTMTDRVLQEVKRLQDAGPSADLTNRAKEGARRTYEESLRDNGYWLRRLSTTHLLNLDPADILTRNQRIDSITPQVLQDVFKKDFPADRMTIVSLVPETN